MVWIWGWRGWDWKGWGEVAASRGFRGQGFGVRDLGVGVRVGWFGVGVSYGKEPFIMILYIQLSSNW